MNFKKFTKIFVLLLVVFGLVLTGCGKGEKKETGKKEVTLILGAYTVPKDAYQQEIIPAFQEMWKEKTGQDVRFQESYIASGAQSRAIASGFEADIAALSLEQDVSRLATEGLITHNWKSGKYNGFVTRSVVVMAYRPGNPKQVKDWEDLTAKTIDVIYPSPRTSGGAMWFVNAVYGAGLKITETKKGKKDYDYAYDLLKRVQGRVKVMDKSGRESVSTFENGFGDILLTYENEALLRQKQGKDFPFIIPGSTILIENPIAVVDKYVDKHGVREVAEAFVEFTLAAESQRSFARFGFRAVDPLVFKEFESKYPTPPLLFDIQYLGGWEKVTTDIYGEAGVWTKIINELADEK
ncbi:MAG: sulfate ABC transporter substrate-binding protein [Candidatus Aminicenantes bacterium]|nr:sulfate ABC transporter substrate-binding protein [Candidatus Aminicenantes bacterium]